MDFPRHWCDFVWSSSGFDYNLIPNCLSPLHLHLSLSLSVFSCAIHTHFLWLAYSQIIIIILHCLWLNDWLTDCVCVCVCLLLSHQNDATPFVFVVLFFGNKSFDKLMSWSTYWHRPIINEWVRHCIRFHISQSIIWCSSNEFVNALHVAAYGVGGRQICFCCSAAALGIIR